MKSSGNFDTSWFYKLLRFFQRLLQEFNQIQVNILAMIKQFVKLKQCI